MENGWPAKTGEKEKPARMAESSWPAKTGEKNKQARTVESSWLRKTGKGDLAGPEQTNGLSGQEQTAGPA